MKRRRQTQQPSQNPILQDPRYKRAAPAYEAILKAEGIGEKATESKSPGRQVGLPRAGVFKAKREDDSLWRPDGQRSINVNPLQQVVSPDVSFWDANSDFIFYRAASQFKPANRLDRLVWKFHVIDGMTCSEIAQKLPALTLKQIWSRIQRIITEMRNNLSELESP